MNIKLIEIRDRATCIIALCIDMQPDDYLEELALSRYGYPCDGIPNILITHLDGGRRADNDPYSWGDRTWAEAHRYIIENWASLHTGSVVDVEFILGETKTMKTSEVWP